MADERTRSEDEPGESTTSAAEARSNNDPSEDKRPDDTLAENKTCPECGAPVDDVRATCINCGYEYSEDDHEDLEAGNEFTSGSEVDDEGNELPQEPATDADTTDAEDER